MSLIRIHTEIVSDSAKKIGMIADIVRGAAHIVEMAGASAPVFELNSFGPKVRFMCNLCRDGLNIIALGLSAQAKILQIIANRFEKTDQGGASTFKDQTGEFTNLYPPGNGTNPGTTVEEGKEEVEEKDLEIGLSQNDYDDPMGDNGLKINSAGCLITCFAMIARIHGFDETPEDVNEYLRNHGGYISGTSYANKEIVPGYFESVIKKPVSYTEIDSRSEVDQMIKEGNPVIIHVRVAQNNNNGGDGHWVLANGIDENGNYIVYEAGTGKQSTYSPDKLMIGHKVFKVDQ